MRTAFVLGAGLGTRLRPLTNVLPKPLIPVCNRPLITYAFDHLAGIGIERFVVNTHWLPDAYDELFPKPEHDGRPIYFRHEPDILETAGGIKNVADLLGDEPFIVYNGDILTDLPLAPALQAHQSAGNEVTLVLRSVDEPRQVAFAAASGRVVDIGGKLGRDGVPKFLFTGVYLVEPAFLARIPPQEKISVIPLFLEMIRTDAKLGAVVIDEGTWWDLGSRERYLAVHRHFAERDSSPWVAPTATATGAQVIGASAIGAGAKIGAGARVQDSLVWPGAEIAPGADLRDCIVTGTRPVTGVHADSDL